MVSSADRKLVIHPGTKDAVAHGFGGVWPLDEDLEQELATRVGPAHWRTIAWALVACGFDPVAYLATHQDVADAGYTALSAPHHYLLSGYAEDRTLAPAPLLCGRFAPLLRSTSPEGYAVRVVRAMAISALKEVNRRGDSWGQVDEPLAALREVGLRPFIMLGDSHSGAYHDYRETVPLALECPAGSALGLGNPLSRSGYGNRIKDWSRRNSGALAETATPVFLKFGQVDVEFVQVFRQLGNNSVAFDLDVAHKFARESVTSYWSFIDALPIDRSLLRVCAIFPPTLSDKAWARGYVNAHISSLEYDATPPWVSSAIRRLEIPDLPTRTDLHAHYNHELRHGCHERGISFVDDFTPLVGNGGTVDAAFLAGHDGTDHHLPRGRISVVVRELLDRFA